MEAPAAAPALPSATPAPTVPAEPEIDWNLRFAQVWAVGVWTAALYGMLSYVNLKRRLRESVPAGRGIREADGIRSPFVLGLLRPVIYLPSGLEGREREHILLHERFHVRHGDHLVKGLFWVAVCIHWFNPLVWLAFVLCGRDMELRCDEAVLKKLGDQGRSGYAQSLLRCAAGRRLAPTPLAFCEGDTGKRVKHALKWKRKKWWLAVPAAALCVTVLVLSACNPDPHLAQKQQVFDYRYRSVPVMGEPSKPGQICYLREYDGHLIFLEGEELSDLGELKQQRLGTEFDLTNEERERELRKNNELAWKTGKYWVLYQKNGSVYLVDGLKNVRRLERIYDLRVRVQTPDAFGSRYDMREYPLASGAWEGEELPYVAVGDEATLVWTQSGGEKILEVREEYHQMNPDGSDTVIDTAYSLGITRDYGFELPIARRGECGGDWAMYRVNLGLSSYVFCVRFGGAVPEQTGYPVYEAMYHNSAGDFDRTFSLSPKDGAYVHFLVDNLRQDLHCFIGIEGGEVITLEPGASGVVTAPVRKGEYRFRCFCDIDGVEVRVQIIQTDSPVPPERVRVVTFSEGAATITLPIPANWSYAVTSLADNENQAGITFWPTGHEEGVLRFEYYPQRFAVCGTGLENSTMTLAGQEVTVGTYDGRELWDYICFQEHIAVWGEGHERWWAAYGEQAMEILNSVQYTIKVLE